MIAGLKPYPVMKDSSVEWLGEVPEHWEVRRNGRLFAQRNETGFADLPILEVSLRTGVRVRDFETSVRKQVMSDRDKYKRARTGDIAYNTMRMWQGAVGIAPTDGLISPAYVIARPLPGTTSRYFELLFRIPAYMQEVDNYSRGIVKDRNRLYWEDFKAMPSCYPPPSEQAAIVRYLDHVDRRVRRLVRAKRKLIALLTEQKQAIIHRAVTRGLDPDVPLKDSGVEWLGEVPEHWEVRRLKHWLQMNQSVLSEKTDPNFSFEYLDIGSVGTGSLINSPERIRFEAAPSRARRVVRTGDTIVSTVRTYLKAVWHAEDQVSDLVASTGFVVLTPPTCTSPKYLSYLAQSDSFTNRVTAESVGIAYPAIAESKLGTFEAAIPPLSEQAAIVEYLDQATADIDTTISRAEREIELLNEYRTRLIADVVTGKFDVRDAAAALPQVDPLAEDDDANDLDTDLDLDAEELDEALEEVEA